MDIPGAGRLVICQWSLTEENFRAFHDALNSDSLKLEILLGQEAPYAKIAETRHLMQTGLGHTAARVVSYYTLPDIQRLIGNAEGALEAVLSALQDQLNLPFKSSYAALLGNFEIFDLNVWLDRPQPFLIEVVTGSNFKPTGSETLQISRTPEFAQERHIAHIVGRVYGQGNRAI